MIDDAVNIRGLKRYAVDHAGLRAPARLCRARPARRSPSSAAAQAAFPQRITSR